MKKLLPILFVLIITSCSKEVPSDQLVERDGVYYEVNSQTGFTGTSISYYENGQLEEKRNYKNGKRHGNQEMYFENGQLESKEEYKDGLIIDGIYESYEKNGQLFNKSTYKNHKLVYRETYISGQLIAIMTVNEDRSWEHKYYYDDRLYQINTYDKDNEKLVTEEYYENGQLESKENWKDGQLHGPRESYSQNGELEKQSCYKEGISVVMSYCD